MDVGGYSKSLADISRYLILIKIGGIIRSVESNGFFRYGVDINKNLRLMDLSRFLKFQFRVKAVYYKTFLLIMGGGK